MTEKEREQELFNRIEQREVLKTRFEIERKLKKAKEKEQRMKAKKDGKKEKSSSSSSSPGWAILSLWKLWNFFFEFVSNLNRNLHCVYTSLCRSIRPSVRHHFSYLGV